MQGAEAEAEAEWAEAEGAEAEDEAEGAEAKAEAEGAEAEAEGAASKSVYQRGMTRVPDRLDLQHRPLIKPDGEK